MWILLGDVSDCEELVGPITISSTIKNPITEGL